MCAFGIKLVVSQIIKSPFVIPIQTFASTPSWINSREFRRTGTEQRDVTIPSFEIYSFSSVRGESKN